jgi:hypothetical protein
MTIMTRIRFKIACMHNTDHRIDYTLSTSTLSVKVQIGNLNQANDGLSKLGQGNFNYYITLNSIF